MDIYENIIQLQREIQNVRKIDDQEELKKKLEEFIYSLRKIHHDFFNTKGTIDWLEIERISTYYKEKTRRKREIKPDEIDQLYLTLSRFLESIKIEILPRKRRYFHFFGSIVFIFIIPVLKFVLSYTNKVYESGGNEEIAISNFDLTLPFIMYSWIASYATKSGIRRTWILTFTLVSTSFLLKSNEANIFFLLISILTIFVFIIHVYDTWFRHVKKYESFSFFD